MGLSADGKFDAEFDAAFGADSCPKLDREFETGYGTVGNVFMLNGRSSVQPFRPNALNAATGPCFDFAEHVSGRGGHEVVPLIRGSVHRSFHKMWNAVGAALGGLRLGLSSRAFVVGCTAAGIAAAVLAVAVGRGSENNAHGDILNPLAAAASVPDEAGVGRRRAPEGTQGGRGRMEVVQLRQFSVNVRVKKNDVKKNSESEMYSAMIDPDEVSRVLGLMGLKLISLTVVKDRDQATKVTVLRVVARGSIGGNEDKDEVVFWGSWSVDAVDAFEVFLREAPAED